MKLWAIEMLRKDGKPYKVRRILLSSGFGSVGYYRNDLFVYKRKTDRVLLEASDWMPAVEYINKEESAKRLRWVPVEIGKP